MTRSAPRLAALALVLAIQPLAAQAAPRSGAEVLERMRRAYDGKWYHTLTFVQKTTVHKQDGTTAEQTWYESLRHTPQSGTRLRIDVGDPGEGNGMLYTADSTYVVRAGKVVMTRGEGNEFLPMIEGVYVQPVERTIRELAPTKVDMSKVSTGTWDGRRVWIVGASAASDSTSPQFWIDVDRNVVVRMILAPAPSVPTMDIRLGGYEPVGGGWLATRIDMLVGGVPRQTEEYSSWKAGVALEPALFEPATWTSATHWATKK
jgi:hypothetical protein